MTPPEIDSSAELSIASRRISANALTGPRFIHGRQPPGSPGKTARDDIVVCEVMVETLEPEWWRQYRRGPEQAFAQDELIVRSQEIKRL